MRGFLWMLVCLLGCTDAEVPVPPPPDGPAARLIDETETAMMDAVQLPLGRLPERANLSPLGARSMEMAALLNQMFEGLVVLDDSLGVAPGLAASWEVSADQRVYTFGLREALFHDGTPLEAAHVVASWEAFAQRALNHGWIIAPIRGAADVLEGRARHLAGVSVLDDGRLRVELEEPDGIFLRHLAMPNLAAFHRGDQGVVGCGPYRLAAHDPSSRMLRLAPHEQYHGRVPGVSLVYREESLPVRAFQRGRLDLAPFTGPCPLFDSSGVRTYPCLSTTYAAFDPRVPDALRVLVNQLYVQGDFLGTSGRTELPAYGPVPPGLAGHVAEPDSLLLAFPQPYPAVLTVALHDTALQDFLRRELKAFDVEVVAGEPALLRQSTWIADFPDSDNFLRILFASDSPQNLARFSDPQVDSLLVVARRLSVTAAEVERRRLYEQAVVRIRDRHPWLFLWHGVNRVLVSPRVRGLRTSALDFDGTLMLPQTDLELVP